MAGTMLAELRFVNCEGSPFDEIGVALSSEILMKLDSYNNWSKRTVMYPCCLFVGSWVC